MDNTFTRVADHWTDVDVAMEKVEEAPFYTEETAAVLESAAATFLEGVKLWRRQHGDHE
jgi:hypothetical protein